VEYHTSVDFCLDALAGKWKVLILSHLSAGHRRLTDILALTPGLSRRVLIRELRELEADAVVTRLDFDEKPPRVEYELTEHGAALEPIIQAMHEWGLEHIRHLQENKALDMLTAESFDALQDTVQDTLQNNPEAREMLAADGIRDASDLGRQLQRRGKRLGSDEHINTDSNSDSTSD
jgi:DNA-binding HxlR family transcriptional regulator